MFVLSCPGEKGLFEVEAFTEGGVVEVDDGDELTVPEPFGEGQFCDANLEVRARLVDIAN